jgi:hypothetical protein
MRPDSHEVGKWWCRTRSATNKNGYLNISSHETNQATKLAGDLELIWGVIRLRRCWVGMLQDLNRMVLLDLTVSKSLIELKF